MRNKEKPAYGGQAVVEGVMFGGKNHTVTAIRRKDHTIDYFYLPKKSHPITQKLKKIPFVRRIVALIEASSIGTQHLNFSTDHYDVDPEDDEKIKKEEKTSKLTLVLGVATIGVLSLLFSKFIFT